LNIYYNSINIKKIISCFLISIILNICVSGCKNIYENTPILTVKNAINNIKLKGYYNLNNYVTEDMLFYAKCLDAKEIVFGLDFKKAKYEEIIENEEALVGITLNNGKLIKLELRKMENVWKIDVKKERFNKEILLSDLCFIVKDGDLILSDDKSIQSFWMKNYEIKDRRFSNIGIIIKDKYGINVIGTYSSKGNIGYKSDVVIDVVNLSDFLSDKTSIGIYRVKGNKKNKVSYRAVKHYGLYNNGNDFKDYEGVFCSTDFVETILKELKISVDLKKCYIEKYKKEVLLVEEFTRNEYFEEIVYLNVEKIVW
jgi:hypothetical protein